MSGVSARRFGNRSGQPSLTREFGCCVMNSATWFGDAGKVTPPVDPAPSHDIKKNANRTCGELAQLGERLVCNQEVTGSSPVFSTKTLPAERFAKASRWQGEPAESG